MSKVTEARDAYMLAMGTYNGLRDAIERAQFAQNHSSKAALATVRELHRLLSLDATVLWDKVIVARDAWHAAQDTLPIGRSGCRCGCMGRPLEGEAGFDPAAWPGYAFRKAI